MGRPLADGSSRMSPCVRSGYVAANSVVILVPSWPLNNTAWVGSHRVHDRADVVHPGLERGHAGDTIGQPGPSLVQHEQPSVLGQSRDVTDKERVLPRREHVSREPAREHQIDRPVADGLVTSFVTPPLRA